MICDEGNMNMSNILSVNYNVSIMAFRVWEYELVHEWIYVIDKGDRWWRSLVAMCVKNKT